MGLSHRIDRWIQHRPIENQLMLQQLLATIRARFLLLPSQKLAPEVKPAFDEVKDLIDRYRAWELAQAPAGASESASQAPSGPKPTLPTWAEAGVAEQLLAELVAPEDLPGEVAQALEQLKEYDPVLQARLEGQWEQIKSAAPAPPADGGSRFDVSQARGLLKSALRRSHWKRTERYLIRKLSTVYAWLHTIAFALVVVLGVAVVLLELWDPPWHFGGALTGLALAVAAGLLGASFSSLTRRGRIEQLDNLEQARVATGPAMLAIRLGVGVGAAIVLYFLFQTGLLAGDIFPSLSQLGFGVVSLDDLEVTKMKAQAAEELMGAIAQARDDLSGLLKAADPTAAEALRSGLTEIDANLAKVTEDNLTIRPRLGQFVPNPDLSKLFVWSFVAGFSEQMVPTLLADASTRARLQEQTPSA